MCAREKGSEEAEAEEKREKEEAGEAATYGNHENPQTNIKILRENDYYFVEISRFCCHSDFA